MPEESEHYNQNEEGRNHAFISGRFANSAILPGQGGGGVE
ncbi:MAG: hypothetical protein ACI8W8_002687, partial [Rhodothermales bacterium]